MTEKLNPKQKKRIEHGSDGGDVRVLKPGEEYEDPIARLERELAEAGDDEPPSPRSP
jgi:hypothetical protein